VARRLDEQVGRQIRLEELRKATCVRILNKWVSWARF